MDNMIATLKRTRAKTPCFWIGQLDGKSGEDTAWDPSKTLAGEYQAMLPPRSFTPLSELDTPAHHTKTLRKIKGQQSLRDLVTCQEITTPSDSNTLVGTPSLRSPSSGSFSWTTSLEYQECEVEDEEYEVVRDNGQKDLGFQICMDLLSRELAAGFSKKNPAKSLDRASGLQILLMIEAYEAVQQQIRQEIRETHVTGAKVEEMKTFERTLDNWLGALYALYDRSESFAM